MSCAQTRCGISSPQPACSRTASSDSRIKRVEVRYSTFGFAGGAAFCGRLRGLETTRRSVNTQPPSCCVYAKKSPAQGRASSGGNHQEQESPKLADSIVPGISGTCERRHRVDITERAPRRKSLLNLRHAGRPWRAPQIAPALRHARYPLAVVAFIRSRTASRAGIEGSCRATRRAGRSARSPAE